MPTVIGMFVARGGGSTLFRKNTYLILGKPIIQYALESCIKAGFIDKIFVWTEDEEIRAIAEKVGATPLHRPKDMVHYHNGLRSLHEWNQHRTEQVMLHLGTPGDVCVSFNCNNFLVRPETLREMYRTLQEKEELGTVTAAMPVRPGMAICHPENGTLFPFWNDPQFSYDEHPLLFRKLGVVIADRMRLHRGKARAALHMVAPEEGFDFQTEDDLLFAEYYLLKKTGQLSGLKERSPCA